MQTLELLNNLQIHEKFSNREILDKHQEKHIENFSKYLNNQLDTYFHELDTFSEHETLKNYIDGIIADVPEKFKYFSKILMQNQYKWFKNNDGIDIKLFYQTIYIVPKIIEKLQLLDVVSFQPLNGPVGTIGFYDYGEFKEKPVEASMQRYDCDIVFLNDFSHDINDLAERIANDLDCKILYYLRQVEISERIIIPPSSIKTKIYELIKNSDIEYNTLVLHKDTYEKYSEQLKDYQNLKIVHHAIYTNEILLTYSTDKEYLPRFVFCPYVLNNVILANPVHDGNFSTIRYGYHVGPHSYNYYKLLQITE
jgi:hypothetical protein